MLQLDKTSSFVNFVHCVSNAMRSTANRLTELTRQPKMQQHVEFAVQVLGQGHTWNMAGQNNHMVP